MVVRVSRVLWMLIRFRGADKETRRYLLIRSIGLSIKEIPLLKSKAVYPSAVYTKYGL